MDDWQVGAAAAWRELAALARTASRSPSNPAWLIALGGHRGAFISYVVREAGGLVAGPGEDDFILKQRHGRAL
jgi:hypothetical protein